VLVTLVTVGPTKALIVLGLVVAVQQLEGYLLHPFVMRRTVRLHPVVVLVALTAGAVLRASPARRSPFPSRPCSVPLVMNYGYIMSRPNEHHSSCFASRYDGAPY
jgi:hypothetical protein